MVNRVLGVVVPPLPSDSPYFFCSPTPWSCSPMLTDAECKNATCPFEKNRARLACSGGLYLEVSPAGSKRWFWKYRKDGKEGRMSWAAIPM